MAPEPLVTTIANCARCGGLHNDLAFSPFTNRPPRYTHFAACPENGEPILLLIEPDDEPAAKG